MVKGVLEKFELVSKRKTKIILVLSGTFHWDFKLPVCILIVTLLFFFSGVILGTNIEIAIKFEPISPEPMVAKEFMFYTKLKAFGNKITDFEDAKMNLLRNLFSVGFNFHLKAPTGFPTVYYYGIFLNYAVLIMEKVGDSLKKLVKVSKKLSLATVARIGKQAV